MNTSAQSKEFILIFHRLSLHHLLYKNTVSLILRGAAYLYMGYDSLLLRVEPGELQSHPPSCFTWVKFFSSWLGLIVEMHPEQNLQQHVHSQESNQSRKE